MKPKTRKSRMGLKKAKKMITKLHKTKAKKNMDTFFLKCKTTALLTPTQGVATSNYYYGWYPLLQATGTGIGTNSEFNLYRLQYDKVRVNSVKITITPKANVFDQGNAQNDTSYTLTGDGAIHTAIDRDGPAPSSTAAISRYPSYRKYSVMKKFSRSFSVKYPTGVWLDCQNVFGNQSLIDQLGLAGSITVYGENFVEDKLELYNEPWAEVLIEYNCVFQGKTSASLSFTLDASGNPVSAIQTRWEQTPNVAPSPLLGIRGTISDTRLIDTETTIAESHIGDNPSFYG